MYSSRVFKHCHPQLLGDFPHQLLDYFGFVHFQLLPEPTRVHWLPSMFGLITLLFGMIT
jgi:hypothetical protein